LKTPEISRAFESADRADFVLPEYKSRAYENVPLPLDHGQAISQPFTVAFMVELLAPEEGERVLEVGFGSGWQTAILAETVGKRGAVFAVEYLPEVFEFGRDNLKKYELAHVTLFLGDGSKGLAQHAPYDKIIAGAAAEHKIPTAWKEQLAIGGRMVAPLKDSIVVIDRVGKDEYSQKEYFGFRFVPLIEE